MITTFTSTRISRAIFEIVVGAALDTLHKLRRGKGKGKRGKGKGAKLVEIA
jgi:hypothetical protein